MIASRIDSRFLLDSQALYLEGPYVVGLVVGARPHVIASSDPRALPLETLFDSLAERFLVTGQEVLDHGATEVPMVFHAVFSEAQGEGLDASQHTPMPA